MIAIYKKELRSYFTSMIGFVFVALFLVVVGIYFTSYNLVGGYANFDPLSILGVIGSAFSLGSTVFGIIKNRNAGWYSWDRATQRANLRVMLDQAFTQSRRSSKRSAEEFLWAQLQNYTNKDDSLSKFLSRSDNSWVKAEIRAYEEEYGFSLGEVTPLDLTAFPLLIVAIGAVVGWAVFTIIKNRK